VKVEALRLSGTVPDWHRANRTFVQELRRQFLLWRTLSGEHIEAYRMQTSMSSASSRGRRRGGAGGARVSSAQQDTSRAAPIRGGRTSGPKVDRDLEEFRSLMEPPSTFTDGFTWPSFFGALFVAFLMVPGGMYMSLVAGMDPYGAAGWVTVILFIEVARRANKTLKKAELFILFYLVGSALAMPFEGILWNQFFVQSSAARANGITEQIPAWWRRPTRTCSPAAPSSARSGSRPSSW